MVAAYGLVGAGAVVGLLVHFYCEGGAGLKKGEGGLVGWVWGGEKGVEGGVPVASQIPETPFEPPTLQARLGEETSVTGELFGWREVGE